MVFQHAPTAKSISKAQARDWEKVKEANKEKRIHRNKKYILNAKVRQIEEDRDREINRVKAELGILEFRFIRKEIPRA